MKKYIALTLAIVMMLLSLMGCSINIEFGLEEDQDEQDIRESVYSNAAAAALKAEIKNAYSAFVAETALDGRTYKDMEDYYYVSDEGQIYAVEADGDVVCKEGFEISGVTLGEYSGYTLYETDNAILS